MDFKTSESDILRTLADPATTCETLRLQHATRILQQAGQIEALICRGGGPLDRALQAYQRAHPKLGKNDRLVLGTAAYHFARNRSLYLDNFREFSPGNADYLILALAEACGGTNHLGQIPHLPDGVRPWRSRLAHLNRRREAIATALAPLLDADPRQPDTPSAELLAERFSVPAWWLQNGPWVTTSAAASELLQLKNPQQLTLRVQQHRDLSRLAVLDHLGKMGVPAQPTRRSPWGIVVQGRHNVLATDLYRDGIVEVQDEGSQLVACLCDPKPTEKVLDLCAGGGGKALALASAMTGRGDVVAFDTDSRRLADTARRARKAGLGNIRIAKSLTDIECMAPYDIVLTDVPCTSSGTLRRNPDVAWRWSEKDFANLVEQQASILDQGAGLVRRGGHLVYATCSLLEPENTAQIRNFLKRQPEFRPAPPGDRSGHQALADLEHAKDGFFRLPANLIDYAGDAFFAARLQRL